MKRFRAKPNGRVGPTPGSERGVLVELLPGLVNDVTLHEVLRRLPPEALDALAHVSEAWRAAVFANLTELPPAWTDCATDALLARLPRLRVLRLGFNRSITMAGLAMAASSCLQALHLDASSLRGALPDALRERLRVLDLGTDSGRWIPAQMPALEVLRLGRSYSRLQLPRDMPSLRVLMLEQSFDLELPLPLQLSGLEALHLGDESQIDQLPDAMPRLRLLHLNRNWRISALAREMPALEDLHLGNSHSVAQLPERLPQLRRLNLGHNRALPALPRDMPALEELALGRNTRIAEVPDGLTRLRLLDLGDNRAVITLPPNLPALRDVYFFDVNGDFADPAIQIPSHYCNVTLHNAPLVWDEYPWNDF